MRSSLTSGHYEDTIKWAQSMGQELQAGGLERLMDASFATEKSLAALTASQAFQIRYYLLTVQNDSSIEGASLLLEGMKATNVWLDAMIMLHWITLTRISGIVSFIEIQATLLAQNEIIRHVRESRQTAWQSFYSLMEAVVELVNQIITSVSRYRHSFFNQPLVEHQTIQVLHQVDELFRLIARKQNRLTTLTSDHDATRESTLQQMHPTLYTSLQNLEGYTSPSTNLSIVFKNNLKDALLPLKRYSHAENISHTTIQAKNQFHAPWLSSEVLPGMKKSHKVHVKSKKWKK